MNDTGLAKLVLLCTRAIIEVVVCCTDGPGNMPDVRRVASIRQALTRFQRYMDQRFSVANCVTTLEVALGYEEEDGS